MLNRVLKHPSFSRYASGMMWSYLGQIVAGISSFCLSIFVAHYIDKNTYGSYRYVLSVIGIVSVFGLTGLRVAVARSAATGYQYALRSAAELYTKYSLGTLTLTVALGCYYLYKENFIFGLTFVICGIVSVFAGRIQYYTIFLTSIQSYRQSALYAMYTDLIMSSMMVLVILIHPHVLTLTLTFFFSNYVTNAYFNWLTQKNLTTAKPDSDKSQEMESQAKHQSLANFFSLIVTYIDKLIVFQFVGAVELAIYSFSLAMPEFLKTFVKLISTLFFPALSNARNVQRVKKVLTVTIASSICVSVAAVVFYLFTARFWYETFFSNYQASIYPSMVYSLVILIASVQTPINNFFAARINNNLLHHATIASAIIQIIVLVIGVLISPSVLGVITAKLIGQVLGLFYVSTVLALRYRGAIL